MEGGIFSMIFQLKSMEGLESKRYTPQAVERSEAAYIIDYYALNNIQVNLLTTWRVNVVLIGLS